jgi:hypothetical protein
VDIERELWAANDRKELQITCLLGDLALRKHRSAKRSNIVLELSGTFYREAPVKYIDDEKAAALCLAISYLRRRFEIRFRHRLSAPLFISSNSSKEGAMQYEQLRAIPFELYFPIVPFFSLPEKEQAEQDRLGGLMTSSMTWK